MKDNFYVKTIYLKTLFKKLRKQFNKADESFIDLFKYLVKLSKYSESEMK